MQKDTEQKNASKTYALLIGIDNYQPSEIYKDLRGCVGDINLVDSYLQQSLQLPSEQIYRLTAPLGKSKLLNVRASADPKPTYDNIVQAFNNITNTAQAGDRIYLHYSGHGGRVLTSYPEIKDKQDCDEGLVPYDYPHTGRYLRDVEIATLLKRMTDKGLVVTFILDCCHSGGATRGDSAIRGASEIDRKLDLRQSLVGTREELIENWRSLSNKPASSGLLPAADYILLAACRPTEYAFEYAVRGDERHGALTFWTIDTLKALGNNISYQTLHNRVSAKIQSRHPAQLPMLIGDGDKTVFSSDRQQVQYAATVLKADPERNTIVISAGGAQGIGAGARFAIYPLNADLEDDTQQQAIIEVQQSDATQSTGHIVPLEDGGLAVSDTIIEQGAPAKMLAASVELVRQVDLSGLSQHPAPLKAVRAAIANNGWLVEATEDKNSHYQVSVSQNENYEICSEVPIENLSPSLNVNQTEAAGQVVKRLVHLCKYQAVQALDNPGSSINQALKCQLLDENRQPFFQDASQGNRVTIQKDKTFFLQIRNQGRSSLNIAVLNLEPTWEISQVAIQGQISPFYQLGRGATEILPLRFSLPDSDRYSRTQEIVKIFATVGPTDFRYLLLPTLDEEIQSKGTANNRSVNAFSKLLEAVGSDINSKPPLTRAVISMADPSAQWTTQQFSLAVAP